MKETWGPSLWHILHTIAKQYPNRPNARDKFYANQMINILAFIIPCFKCQRHYMTNITKYKPNFDNSEKFFKWTVKLHNIVNKLNNKQIFTVTQAMKVTENVLNSSKIQRLFLYLRQESNNYNISKTALIKFVDIITYFNNRITQLSNNKVYNRQDVRLRK